MLMYFGVLCHRWTASTATGQVWSPSPTSSGSTSTAWNTSSTRCNIKIDLKILAPHQPEVLVSCLLFPPKQIHTLPHLLWLVGINDFIIRFFYCRKKKNILIRCKTTTVTEHSMLTEDILQPRFKLIRLLVFLVKMPICLLSSSILAPTSRAR